MFTKSEMRRLRKTARRLQVEAGDCPIAHTSCFSVHFIGGRLMSGRIKSYGQLEDFPNETCYQARDGGVYTYGGRIPIGDEYDPSGFENLFAQCPGESVFTESGIGPYSK